MATDVMTAVHRDRLREWYILQAEADYNERMQQIEDAVAGHDLYERPLTDLNDRRCDYHTATVFRLSLNEVRKKRKSFRYRFLALMGWV